MLTKKIRSLTKEMEQIKKEVIGIIDNLEQNPKIKMLSKNCFVIRKNNLSNDLNLSPFYYNHKLQYEYISDIINNSRIENILSVLKNIIKTGWHKKAERTRNRVKFCPEVINKLKTLI